MFQVLRVPSENVASVWRANWLVRVCDCVRERKCMCARACASVCVMCVRVFACIAYAFIRFVWCVQRVTERVINPTVARGACMWWGGCTGGRLGRARVSERMLTDGDGRVCTKATAPCGLVRFQTASSSHEWHHRRGKAAALQPAAAADGHNSRDDGCVLLRSCIGPTDRISPEATWRLLYATQRKDE